MRLSPSIASLLAAAWAGAAAWDAPRVPSPAEVMARRRASDAVLLDRRGRALHELRLDHGARRLDWAGLGEISPILMSVVVRAEDRRFRSHGGVDWLAAGAGAARAVLGGGPRGASTITMQLASFLEPSLRGR